MVSNRLSLIKIQTFFLVAGYRKRIRFDASLARGEYVCGSQVTLLVFRRCGGKGFYLRGRPEDVEEGDTWWPMA